MADDMQTVLQKLLGRPINEDAQRALAPSATPSTQPAGLSPEADVADQKSPQGAPFYLDKSPAGGANSEIPHSAPSNDDDELDPDEEEANSDPEEPSEEDPQGEDDADDDESESPEAAPAIARAPAASPDQPQVAANPMQKTLDFGSADQNKNKFGDALAKRQSMMDSAKMNRGFHKIAAGLARLTPDISDYAQDVKQAEFPLEEFKLKQEQEAQDPQSGFSKGMRDYMKTLGINVSDGTTATQMQKVAPYVFKDMEAKQMLQAKKDLAEQQARYHHDDLLMKNKMLSQRQSELGASKAQTRNDKLDKQANDEFAKMGKEINSGTASSRTALGRAAGNAQAIQNAEALINGTADLNQIDNRQIQELARVMDKVLSGGGATISGTEHLTPQTARMLIAKKLEYYTNHVQGAGAQSFIKRMQDTLEREKDVAAKQIIEVQKHGLAGHKHLATDYPERWQEFLMDAGVPADVLERVKAAEQGNHEKGSSEPKSQMTKVDIQDPKDQAGIQKLMQNNSGMSPEAAAKALHDYKLKNGH